MRACLHCTPASDAHLIQPTVATAALHARPPPVACVSGCRILSVCVLSGVGVARASACMASWCKPPSFIHRQYCIYIFFHHNNTYTYSYTYIHIQMHTHIHTYTYTIHAYCTVHMNILYLHAYTPSPALSYATHTPHPHVLTVSILHPRPRI